MSTQISVERTANSVSMDPVKGSVSNEVEMWGALFCSLLAFDELARELEKRESQLMEMRKTLSHSVMRDVRRIAQDCDGEKLRDFYEKLYELDNANRWASLSKHDRKHFRESLLAACDAAYRLSTSEERAYFLKEENFEDGFRKRHHARLRKAKAGAN